ncbi:prolyl 4-hydroxylase alpha subunit-like protein [Skeletonema marinoi]|uniref:Prolyl 4-hydroxylase alpha subunit-like protein n=1 Tax=Skeletonema marinoi TaxID=267567 RepID=A0AAD8Y8K1_9STRA|nr:prolyl 4-hydroxylase alpha subunit-like protein [Skeletonema marinoi]
MTSAATVRRCPSLSQRTSPAFTMTAATKILAITSSSFLLIFSFTALQADAFTAISSPKTSTSHHHNHHCHVKPALKLHATTTTTSSTTLSTRIPINESYPGLQKVHTNPDIYIISHFLSPTACNDLISRARLKGTQRSPVAYAGWTDDIKDLLGLAASGPVSWGAILGAWYEAQGDESANAVLNLVLHALRNYSVLLVVAGILIAGYTKVRADGLQELRTSTSTTLDDLSDSGGGGDGSGVKEFVLRSADLFGPPPSLSSDDDILSSPVSYFEAPTVINYEKDQALAPHYDANRSASVEDANRGGQTLSTLLVYLNDVERGGTTKFGKLPAITSSTNDDNNNNDEEDIIQRQVIGDPNLNIIPRKGDALLFFPADKYGRFDERTEHEGCPAVDEKWIARIWKHEGRVPPPFGLSDECIREYC